MPRVDMKKICFVIPNHWTHTMGGAQYQMKLIVEHLVATGGYEIFIAARNFGEGTDNAGYTPISVRSRLGVGGFNRLGDGFKLSRTLHDIRPDIIYQRVGCAYTGYCAYYAKRANIPMFWHVALDNDVLPVGKLEELNQPYMSLEKRVLEYGVRNTSNIIAQTCYQEKMLEQYYGRSVSAVIGNFHPAPVERITKTDPVKVVWVANLKPSKSPETFVNLAARFAGNANVSFIMIGGLMGNTAWNSDILEKIDKTPNVTYLGHIAQAEVNEHLAQSHILVNTSQVEGFSNTFIQAWLRKVPVVSLSVDPDGVLGKKKVGLCSGSFDRLVEDVGSLVSNEKLRDTMGENAALHAAKYHSNSNIDQLIELFGRS